MAILSQKALEEVMEDNKNFIKVTSRKQFEDRMAEYIALEEKIQNAKSRKEIQRGDTKQARN